jgi:hypothetical protein
VREAKREQAAYESATLSKVEIGNAARSRVRDGANRRGDWPPLHCTLDRRRFDCEIPEVVATGFPGNTRNLVRLHTRT